MITRRNFLGAGAILTLASKGWATSPRDLDMVVRGGTIWTGLDGVTRTDALGIVGDRIVAIGNNAVSLGIGTKTRVLDLDGAFAMPAFIDGHTHFLRAAQALGQPDLLQARGRADFARLIGAAARQAPGRWITGRSWDEVRMGGELPTKEWIDAVTPDTPVAVPRTDLHTLLLNSRALALAGIDRHTPAPEGGEIIRDARGEPTGLLKDNAKNLVTRVIPDLTREEKEDALRQGIALAHRNGIAQVHNTEKDWTTHEVLLNSNVARNEGLRFYSFVPLADWNQIVQIIEERGRGDEWVRWGGVKGASDGSLGARTALFHEPYADDPTTSGLRVTPKEELRELVIGADAAGLQVAVHAIGDLSNDEVLDILDEVERVNGPRDRRFRIEHAQHLVPSEIPRFARQNVIASVQPYHAADDGRWAERRIGKERLNGTYAFHSLVASGAYVNFGSDWPVAPLDPFTGIKAAVTRETIDGANPGGWIPHEKVTVEQAMVAYTAANAYAGFQENLVGKLRPGFLADIVVLDRDPIASPVEHLDETAVLKTVVGGVERYSA